MSYDKLNETDVYISKIKTADGIRPVNFDNLANRPDMEKFAKRFATVEQLANASLGGSVLYLHTIRFLFLTSDSTSSTAYIDMDVILPYEKPDEEGYYTGYTTARCWAEGFMLDTLFTKGGVIWGNGAFTQDNVSHPIKGVRLYPKNNTYWQLIDIGQFSDDTNQFFLQTAKGYHWKRLRTMPLDGSSYFYADPNVADIL